MWQRPGTFTLFYYSQCHSRYTFSSDVRLHNDCVCSQLASKSLILWFTSPRLSKWLSGWPMRSLPISSSQSQADRHNRWAGCAETAGAGMFSWYYIWDCIRKKNNYFVRFLDICSSKQNYIGNLFNFKSTNYCSFLDARSSPFVTRQNSFSHQRALV